jgi:uncharacterized delta-60 repeat protein
MKLTKIRVLCAVLLFVSAFYINVQATPGDLDATFDGDGKVMTGIGVHDYAQDVAIQADGKIVVAGYSEDAMGSNNTNVSLARYNADGSPDTNFGTGGKVLLSESGTQIPACVVIRTDGKILVIGNFLGHLGVYRFNTDGSLDATFGTGGKVSHAIGTDSQGNDAVLQPDGKIVIAGYVRFTGESHRFTVFRLNADGSLDTSFNLIGYTPVLFGGTAAYAVALQSDGKIVAGGRDTVNDSTGYWGRFGSDGTLEGGVSALVQSTVMINDLAIQTDGKIVFAGYTRTVGSGATNVAVTRFNADKTLDVHFGNSGVNTVNWGAGSQTLHKGYAVLIQSSGRIVVGGYAYFQNFDFALARFNSNGFLDQGFGNGGRVTTQFTGNWEEMYGMAQQADGKIVAVGYTSDQNNNVDFGVARYDGSDSNSISNRAQFDYDGDGKADVSVFRPSTGQWFIFNSGSSTVLVRAFGANGDLPAPADFDGDAKTDLGIYRNGQWWYYSSNGSGFAQLFPWSVVGNPRPGDFTGDGRADLIAYDNGSWNRRNSVNSAISNVSFGIAGDKSLLGDFDGDAKTDPAIYRPSTGEWWYAASSAGGQHRAVHWGISTDIPAPADFDGDFKTDFAVYRASEGVWYIINSSNGSFTILNFGLAEDKPVPADYDGDGKADIAVFRPSTGTWYLMRSTAGFTAMQFGVSTDIPTPNAFVP